MTSVKIIAVTKPLIDRALVDKEEPLSAGQLTADEFIAYTARVSNPSNQMNTLTAPKLVKYLIKNRHWSPFEMVHVVMEINTTRDISHQIIRHRSFSYQEFSQRYADPTKDMGFTTREPRLQDYKNRQNSIEIGDPESPLRVQWFEHWRAVTDTSAKAYKWAVDNGIAKEQARVFLPEGLTNTRLYMAGSLRSWIHYVDVRAEKGTQKEHRVIGEAAQQELLSHFPSLEEYWSNEIITTVPFHEVMKYKKKPWWKFW